MSTKKYKTGKSPLLGQSNNTLVLLVVVNALIFVLLTFLKITYFLSYSDNNIAEILFQKQILNWFTLPAVADKLISRPWTIFVYMFSHYSIWGLISTLLWLWGFGYILQDLTGNKKLFSIYLFGGFAGAIFFLLSVNLIPVFHQNINETTNLIGGGASVMAVAVATTTLAPQYRIFPFINGGIPLWILTVIFAAIDYATIASSSGGYAIAHLAGAAMGYIFISQLKIGNDWSRTFNNFIDWINDLFNPQKKIESEKFYSNSQKKMSNTTTITQKKLDEILDKIHEQGFQLLSDEEKEFLKRASKEEL